MRYREPVIALITTRSDTVGGSHVYLIEFCKEAKKRGYVPIILVGGEGGFTEKLKKIEVEFIALNHLVRKISPLKDLLAYFEIKKKLKEIKPAIVSCHSSKAGIIGRIAANSLSIPTIFTAHGWSFTEGKSQIARKFYIAIENYVAKKTSKIITVSDYDRDLALREMKISTDKIITIHNGVTDISGNNLLDQSDDGVVNIIMIARFDVPKQQEILLNASALIGVNNFHLYFAGDGPGLERVKSVEKKMRINGEVSFLGNVENIESLLSDMDIFALISDFEGFPLSTIEAMRSKLPVVVSNVGGAPEAVIDGKTGFVVKNDDLNKLAEKLECLINDKDLRVEMGGNGRDRYEKLFNSEMTLEKTFELYNNVLQLT